VILQCFVVGATVWIIYCLPLVARCDHSAFKADAACSEACSRVTAGLRRRIGVYLFTSSVGISAAPMLARAAVKFC
jgi:hypothetical protein